MKELNVLMKYIDYFQYDFEQEKLQILNDQALIKYTKVITDYNINKWHLDIACDCIRKLNDTSKIHLIKYPDVTIYHLSLGLYIRNKYIYPAKKHFYLMADFESNIIVEIILSILHPIYNFGDRKIKTYYYWKSRIKRKILQKDI